LSFAKKAGGSCWPEKILEGHALARRWMKHFKTPEHDLQPLSMAIDLFRSDLSADSAFSVLDRGLVRPIRVTLQRKRRGGN